MTYDTKTPNYYGTGKRKSSIARVRVFPEGTGKFKVNDMEMENYFNIDSLKSTVLQPLILFNLKDKVDIVADVKGGGNSGQCDAIRHGISKALVKFNTEELKALLKKEGFLTRDSRTKERKKYGLKAARRKPQFSKR